MAAPGGTMLGWLHCPPMVGRAIKSKASHGGPAESLLPAPAGRHVRCRRGDAAAWNDLFDRHYEAATRFVWQLHAGFSTEDVEEIWRSVVALYRTGLHPAIGLCVRRRGKVVLQPANADFVPLELAPERVVIQGVVTGLLRKLE